MRHPLPIYHHFGDFEFGDVFLAQKVIRIEGLLITLFLIVLQLQRTGGGANDSFFVIFTTKESF